MITEKDRDSLIEYRLNQALETIELAKFLVVSDKLTIAVNRIYYGMYYALTALALKNKFRLGVIFKHGSFIQIMKREYPLNASFLENIEQELVQIDRQILGSVAKRVTELL